MKLLSAHVDSFGKLKNFDFEFNNGINILRQKNGFGKSTFASFIKAMFYGIGTSKKADLKQNDLKHYAPFNTTTKFGGSLRFEHSGRVFRVERFFGNTPKEHTFKLYDDQTNKLLQGSIDEMQGELGQRIFGLDVDAFERCLYLPQKDVVVCSNDSFMQKLTNIADNTTDQNNLKKAIDSLTKFYKNYKLDKGEGGVLFELRKQREQKSQELMESKLTQQKIDQLNQTIATTTTAIMQNDLNKEQVKHELQKVDKDLEGLGNFSAVCGVQELLKKRKNEKNELAISLEGLKRVQPATPVLPEPPVKPTLVEPKKDAKRPLGIVCFALCLVAVVLAIVVNPLFFMGGVFGVIGLVLVILDSKHKKQVQKGIQNVNFLYQKSLEAYQQQVDKYNKDREVYEEVKKQRDEVETRLSAVQIAISDLESQLNDLAPTGVDDLTKREKDLRERKATLESQKTQYEQLSQTLVSRLAECKKELAVRVESYVLPSYIEGEIENINERLKEAQVKYSCAKKAVELLQQSKENLTQGYLPRLNELFNQNLLAVNTIDFDKATVDANFTVNLLQGGQMRETGYLSTGCQQICDFVLRLSLMQCIYGQNLPLLILDDPFVNYDEDNFRSAFGLLTDLAKDVQILYLTCHER